ncbi:unnamed protein product, partial [marine sediment metagenome]
KTIISAIKFGLKSSSHIFNQMKGIHHREPGTVGAILTEENLFAEIIADCIHIHPAIVNLLVKAKGVDKIIIITDAMRAAGLQDGIYDLGGLKVIVKNSEARLESGNLAGSTLIMSKAVKNMIEKMRISIEKSNLLFLYILTNSLYMPSGVLPVARPNTVFGLFIICSVTISAANLLILLYEFIGLISIIFAINYPSLFNCINNIKITI